MSDTIEDIYRLSPLQQGILFHSLYDPEDIEAPYIAQIVDELTGTLDPGSLRRAWQLVADRHAILRTGFLWAAVSEPVQVVSRAVTVPFTELDWSGFDTGRFDASLSELTAADRRRGFDLSDAPLFRLTLIRRGADRHLLVMTFHHLLLDGWSIERVYAEVAAACQSFTHGDEPSLPPAVPYSDYIRWLAGRSRAGAEDYWRSYLCDYEPSSPFAAVPGAAGSGYEIVRAQLPEGGTDRLLGFCREHGITPNTVVQGALALLLGSLSGEDDVVFGAVTSTRPPDLAGAEDIVGVLVNTLPVRMALSPDAQVLYWLTALQADQLKSREFDYASLSDIGRWCGAEPGTQLFPCLLAYQSYPEADLAGAGPAGHVAMSRHSAAEATGYPLNVVAYIDGKFEAGFCYDASLLSTSAARRAIAAFTALIDAVVSEPTAGLAELPTVSAGEFELVRTWNATEQPVADATLSDLFDAQVALAPEAVALSCGDQEVSYAVVKARTDRLAWRLTAAGIGPGQVVAVMVERSVDLVVSILAVLKAGAAYLPLDLDYPAARLDYMLEDSAAQAIVTRAALRNRIPANLPAILISTDAEEAGGSAELARPIQSRARPGHAAYIIYTSGSTGVPKGVVVEHRAVVNAVLTGTGARFGAGPGDRVLQFAPVSFDASAMEIFVALAFGATLVLLPAGAAAFVAAPGPLEAEVTIAAFPPSILERFTPAQLPSLRNCVVAGERPSSALVERWCSRARMFNAYGPTEAAVVVTVMEIEPGDESLGVVPIGRPLANSRVYILDRCLRPTGVGVAGELYLAGRQLARGYHGRPGLTAAYFVADPFASDGRRMYRTGDVARWRDDGTVEFLGRIDEQVKLRGHRIELGEVESAVARVPGVGAAVAVVHEDDPGDRRLVVFAAPAPGHRLDSETIRLHLRDWLPDYMLPSAIVMMDAIPLTVNGKPDRTMLPAPAASPLGHVAPRTPAEQEAAHVWEAELGVAEVGVHDNFFALGGDSILSVKVAAGMSALGWAVTPKALFRSPTIAELAAGPFAPGTVSADAAPDQGTGLVPLNGSSAPSTVFCLPYGGGGVSQYRELAGLLAPVARVLGVEEPADGPQTLTLTGVAAQMLAAMRSRQPSGPYFLLGYSLGGVYAYEVARLALGAGDQVGLLCVIDSPAPLPAWREFLTEDLELAVEALEGLVGGALVGDLPAPVRAALRAVHVTDDQLGRGREYAADVLRSLIRQLRLVASYEPGRADASLLLFEAQQSAWPSDLASAWGQIVRFVETRPVPGDHKAPLSAPHVTDIARSITAALDHMDRSNAELGGAIA